MNGKSQVAVVEMSVCGECGGCVPVCPTDAIYLSADDLKIDTDLCTGCGDCVTTCPVGALRLADG